MPLLLGTFIALLLSSPQEKTESIPFRVIDKGTSSGFMVPQQMFVSSQKDWAETWTTRQGSAGTKKSHPEIDFNRDVVIVAALGAKSTGGYTIEITRIVRTKDDIQVFLRRTAPPEGGRVVGGATSPFVMARMEKPDRPVTFRDEEPK
ncbi:MAG TPA: protease complex subunit PrcB family protein [Planctomycetota bacterium]|nr:protease complex subunit PrcB family protein [Planctomycetota bacterium]